MTETSDYAAITRNLQSAYDAKVVERERRPLQAWKHAERVRFLDALRGARARSLLDIGAGTGVHAQFFADAGLNVTCVDLSASMVSACRARGLTALQSDVLHMTLPEPVDAAFAMNALLHVPETLLDDAFAAVNNALKPGALFYLGQYGGIDAEGPAPEDEYEPKRFFSFLSDAKLNAVASRSFDVVDFRTVDIGESEFHFQALTLRRR